MVTRRYDFGARASGYFCRFATQNADDNTYPPGVAPTLEFTLQRSAIVAANNEEGFAPQHLRALCDVGASTKARVTGGRAGGSWHGGQGLRAVAAVANCKQVCA